MATSSLRAERRLLVERHGHDPDRSPEETELINQLSFEIHSIQKSILISNGFLGQSLLHPAIRLANSVGSSSSGFYYSRDRLTGNLVVTSSFQKMREAVWGEIVQQDFVSFPGPDSHIHNLKFHHRHEIFLAWVAKTLAINAYMSAGDFVSNLSSLQFEIHIHRDRFPSAQHLDRLREIYISTIESYVELHNCLHDSVSVLARDAYPIGVLPYRIAGLRAKESVIDLISYELGLWARNLLFRGHDLPTDPSSCEVRELRAAMGDPNEIDLFHLAEEIGDVLVYKRLGVESGLRDSDVFGDVIEASGACDLYRKCRASDVLQTDFDELAIALRQEQRAVWKSSAKKWQDIVEASKHWNTEYVGSGHDESSLSNTNPKDLWIIPRPAKWYEQACQEYFVEGESFLTVRALRTEAAAGTLPATQQGMGGHWQYRAIDVIRHPKFVMYADAINNAIESNYQGVKRMRSDNR